MEKSEELFLMRSLLNSKSNIYVHGANGSGKTTFTQDVIKTHNSINGNFLVYVDCIEFNSEKLIAACISQQLNSVVQSALKKLSHRYLFANENALLRLSVRPSRNLDSLLEALNKFTESIDEFRSRERTAREEKNRGFEAKGRGRFFDNHVMLGPFDQFFFFLVLDNVKALFKIER